MVANIDTIFLDDNFVWISDLFEPIGNPEYAYSCPPEQTIVSLVGSEDVFLRKKYFQNVMFALPHSKLLEEAFEVLTQIISTGTAPHPFGTSLFKHNSDTVVKYLPKSIQEAIKVVIYQFQHKENT